MIVLNTVSNEIRSMEDVVEFGPMNYITNYPSGSVEMKTTFEVWEGEMRTVGNCIPLAIATDHVAALLNLVPGSTICESIIDSHIGSFLISDSGCLQSFALHGDNRLFYKGGVFTVK